LIINGGYWKSLNQYGADMVLIGSNYELMSFINAITGKTNNLFSKQLMRPAA